MPKASDERLAPSYSLSVAGFKSIRDPLTIDLGNLTVLAGANSSGKSSAMQPLLLLKQTLEAPYDPGPLQISGTNVKFASVQEMFWRSGNTGAAEQMTFRVDQEDRGIEIRLAPAEPGLRLIDTTYRHDREYSRLRPGLTQRELMGAVPEYWREMLSGLGTSNKQSDRLELDLDVERDRSTFKLKVNPYGIRVLDDALLATAATGLIHLPGLRGTPERLYPATTVGEFFPGIFPAYTASVIMKWGADKDVRLSELSKQLSSLDLTWKVEARRIDDTSVALRVGRLTRARRGGSRDTVSIADVGLGVSQTLPVLVALLVAQPGQIVYIEQPEIHLHPRAQVALAPILIRAARAGAVVVVETHSQLLLRSLQEVAARESVPNGLIRMHWFSRDEEGVTRVNSTDLDSDGAYGDWPLDFADVELDIEDRFLRAVMDP